MHHQYVLGVGKIGRLQLPILIFLLKGVNVNFPKKIFPTLSG